MGLPREHGCGHDVCVSDPPSVALGGTTAVSLHAHVRLCRCEHVVHARAGQCWNGPGSRAGHRHPTPLLQLWRILSDGIHPADWHSAASGWRTFHHPSMTFVELFLSFIWTNQSFV